MRLSIALPRRVYAVIGGAVITSWALVVLDALYRDDWDDAAPLKHFGAALFLLTAVGVLGGWLFAGIGALGRGIRRRAEARALPAARWLEPALAAAFAVALARTTAFWVFSGERIHRTQLATWGPYALIVVFAGAGALFALGTRLLEEHTPRGRRLVALVVVALLVAAGFVRLDMLMYPTLYGRLHTLLELCASLVVGVAASTVLSVASERSDRAADWVRRGALVTSVALPLFALVVPARRWVEEALWYAWREPVYLGRMLSRLQIVESTFRGPKERAFAFTPSIERLLGRHDLTTTTESPEWTARTDEPVGLHDHLLALRDHRSYNVVVFYVDTLRADYARDRKLMPNLSRFAADSLDFTRAYTTGSDTLHALPGIVGGSYDVFEQPDRDLLYWARSAGHRTALVAAKSAREFLGNLLPKFRFDDVVDIPDYGDGRNDVWGYGGDQATATGVVDRGIDWLRAHQGVPHLLWLFNFDLHNWRELDGAYVKKLGQEHGLYDESDPIWRYKAIARSVDVEFGRFLRGLESLESAKDTVVLFLSDHGEGLGHDGFWVHSVYLWESLVHVPLLLRAPGLPPKRVDDVVSLVDVAPTISRYMVKRAETNYYHGNDLLEHAVLEHPKRRHPLVMMGVLNQVPVRLGLIDAAVPFKLVLPLEGAVPELYDLTAAQPDERDWSRERPDVVHHLLERLVRVPTFPRSTQPEASPAPEAAEEHAP
jgi:hypothetical protein